MKKLTTHQQVVNSMHNPNAPKLYGYEIVEGGRIVVENNGYRNIERLIKSLPENYRRLVRRLV